MFKHLGLLLAVILICSCSNLPKSEVYSENSKGATGNPKEIVFIHGMFMNPDGLVSQILLSENLASAAVVLDSAPPRGVFIVSTKFLSANWKIITPFSIKDKPIIQDQESFSASFCNAQSEAEQKRIFTNLAVPESKRVGLGPLTKVGSLNEETARGPLLLVAGSEDNIIPARLAYKNFEVYEDTPGYTEFYLAVGKDHCLMLAPGWEALAETSRNWLEKHLVK